MRKRYPKATFHSGQGHRVSLARILFTSEPLWRENTQANVSSDLWKFSGCVRPNHPLCEGHTAGSDTLEEQAPALLVNVMKGRQTEPLEPVGICLLIRPDRDDCLATLFPWPLLIDVSAGCLSLSLSLLYALAKQLKPGYNLQATSPQPDPTETKLHSTLLPHSRNKQRV